MQIGDGARHCASPAFGDAWATEWDVDAARGGAAAGPLAAPAATVGEPREAAARARRGRMRGAVEGGLDAA